MLFMHRLEKAETELKELAQEVFSLRKKNLELQNQLADSYTKIKEMKDKLDRCTIVEKKDLA